jgi:hypothetical protein
MLEARAELTRLIPLAISTLHELALGAERDNVRLAAAEAILDRTGLSKGATLHVTTDVEEHRQAEAAALALVERIERNRALQGAVVPSPALDALVVLEGDDENLPLASGAQGGRVIDVHEHSPERMNS